MSVSVRDLAAGFKDLAIPVGNDAIHVTYKPEFYTLDIEEALAEARKSEEKMGGFVVMFLDIVQKWDLTDEQDVVIPLSMAGIREAKVTINSLNFVLKAVMEDANSGE